MDLFKQLFLIKQVKCGKYQTKTCFSPQSEPHTAKLCFSVVLEHLGEIHREFLFLLKKVTISEKCTEILRKVVFLNMLF